MSTEVILDVKNLKKYYPLKKVLFSGEKKAVKAVDDISLQIKRGETLGMVGESGCGKSTFGRAVLRLIEPTEGQVLYRGQNIATCNKEEMRDLRKKMQIVFQDPSAALNPRMTVQEIIRSPLDAFHIGTEQEKHDRTHRIMDVVGLSKKQLYKYPHEFSGGQKQRIVIARALILDPEFIVCDEPVSALDVSIRSQVLNLMQDIQKEFGLTYLFISHDLSVVKHISDRVAVMYLGRIVEMADRKTLFAKPFHPYTQALMSAIPIPDTEVKRERILLKGEIPSPIDPPSGCPFHTRCPQAMDVCAEQRPEQKEVSEGHYVYCRLAQ